MFPRGVRLVLPLVVLFVPRAWGNGEPPRTDPYGDPLPKGAISRMGTVRLRQELPVIQLATSTDGKVLASASLRSARSGNVLPRRSIYLWDLTTGKELMCLGRRDAGGGQMAFSPDGKLLASAGCEDATVRVWNVQTGEELHVLFKHHQVDRDGRSSGYAAGVAFSPDGKMLATSGGDQMIRLWDVASGDEIDHWKTQGYVDALAFSPDGKRLAADGGVWDVETGKQLHALPQHPGTTTTVLMLNDGKTIVVGNMGAVRWLGMATGKEMRLVRGILAPPPLNGKEFAVRDEKAAHIYDMADGKEVRTFALPPGSYYTGVLTADGKTLVAVEWQHVRIRAWETQKGHELFPEHGHSAEVTFVGFSVDGKELITAGDNTVRFWEVASGKELRQLRGHEKAISTTAMSADCKTLVTGSDDGTVHIWDLAAHKDVRQLATGGGHFGFQLALSPDGTRLACTQHANPGDAIRLLDATTGKEVLRLTDNHHRSTTSFALAPDGKALARRSGAIIEQWDTVLGKRVGVFESRQPSAGLPPSTVAFSRDGRILASGYSEGKRTPWTVGLWEVASRKLITQLRGHEGPVGVVAFSPGGKLLASGSGDKTVRLWDVASGRELVRFEGHRSCIVSLAFSPDAKRLASGCADGTALVWDIAAYPALVTSAGAPLGPSELGALWADLREDNAAKAFAAIRQLAAAPKQSVPFLCEKLSLGLGEREIPRLIADLDSEQFDVREKASVELERLGKAAEGPLRDALTGRPSSEVRGRVGRLLEKLRSREDGQLTREQLREIREVQALELIATPEAREVLHTLADKGSKGRLRDEARAALARLDGTRRN